MQELPELQRLIQSHNRLVSFPYEQSVPEVIYHYCPLDAFYKIIESGSIFLTHSHYLNDTTDTRYFIELLEKRWSEAGSAEDFENFLKNIRLNLKDYFVACFSAESDSLSQWNMYADNCKGVAIGFYTKHLEERTGPPVPGLQSGGIFCLQYQSAGKPNIADDIMELYSRRILGPSNPPQVDALSLTTKHEKFHHEKEVRLAETRTMQKSDTLEPIGGRGRPSIHYRTRSDGTLVPYVLRKFKGPDKSYHFHSITLGPLNRSEESVLDAFLESNGYTVEDGVHRSCIPYRD